MSKDTLHAPRVKGVPSEVQAELADTDQQLFVPASAQPLTSYQDIKSGPRIFVPSPRVHVISDSTYNTAGKLIENGTADRPFNATALNALRDILEALPDGKSVLIGEGVYLSSLQNRGRGNWGYDIRRSLDIQGAGPGSTIFRVQDGEGNNGSFVQNLFTVGAANTDTDDTTVLLADVTLDGNFQNATVTSGRHVVNALATANKDFHGERIEIINCGQDAAQSAGEEFQVFCVSQVPGFKNRCVLKNINLHSERVANQTVSATHTAMAIGGDVNGGDTHGLVEDFIIDKTVGGVCFGLLGTQSGIDFVRCRADSSSVNQGQGGGINATTFLHDTRQARNCTIRDCYFHPAERSYLIIAHVPAAAEQPGDNELRVVNNVFERSHVVPQTHCRLGGGTFLFQGNQFIGSSSFPSDLLGPAASLDNKIFAFGNTASTADANTVFGNATPAGAGQVLVESDNHFIEDGSLIPTQ